MAHRDIKPANLLLTAEGAVLADPRLPSSNLVEALRHVIRTPPTVTVADPELARLVRWGFAEERAERPATAAEFAHALRKAVPA